MPGLVSLSKTESMGVTIAVSSQQWLKMVFVYLLAPATLMICARDLMWWQGWLYSVLIMAAGIGGHLWAEQRHPGLIAERQDKEVLQSAKPWDKVLAPLVAVSFVFPMVIVAGLDHRNGWTPELPVFLNAVGIVLIALGYTIAAWAMAENRFFYAVVCVRKDRGHAVCSSGPYSFVRHPGYAANILPLFGIILALGSLWALIPAVVALVVTVTRTSFEDRVLQEELPGYQEYAQRVRYRLIPWVY